jgi:hypothetical protein
MRVLAGKEFKDMRRGVKESPASGPSRRETNRLDKAIRALRKSIVHLVVSPGGEEVVFDDETRDKLLNALSRLKPAPSERSSNRMITVAHRVVSDLTAARKKVYQESATTDEEQALRSLLDCAKKLREASGAVFGRQQLRYALDIPVLTGLIRAYDKNVDSDDILRAGFSDVIRSEYFAKFGNKLDTYLEVVIKSTSVILNNIDGAKKIKDSPDYIFAVVLCFHWLKIFGHSPTSFSLDKSKYSVVMPSPFQAFVGAVPLTIQIKDETIRTSVKFSGTVLKGYKPGSICTANGELRAKKSDCCFP